MHRALMSQHTPEEWYEVAELILAAKFASAAADEILERYGRVGLSIDTLKDSLRAVTVRH